MTMCRAEVRARIARPWIARALAAGMLLAGPVVAEDRERAALSVSDAIETARFMTDRALSSARNPDGVVSISPDGRRYLGRLVRGEVDRNGVSMQLFTGGLGSLEAAMHWRAVTRLFSSGRGAGQGRPGADQDTLAAASELRWLDNERVAFLWSDERDVRQVTQVHLTSGRVDALTRHPATVVSFDVSAGGAVLYCAHVPPAPSNLSQALHDGFVIEQDTDAPALIMGYVNGGRALDQLWNTQWFLKRPGDAQPFHVRLDREVARDAQQRAFFSPAGERALVNTNAAQILEHWDAYSDPDVARSIRAARRDRNAMDARNVHQLFVLDTSSLVSRPLWDAVTLGDATRVAWSPDGRSVLLAPTFLPPDDPDPRGRTGMAAAIVKVDTAQYEVLPVDLEGARVIALRWLAEDRLELTTRRAQHLERLHFANVRGRWRAVQRSLKDEAASTGVRLELRQSLNTPPQLYAVDPRRGEARAILDPNPEFLTRFRLGRVERIEGRTSGGERWAGLLFYPPDYQTGERYPLVIQSVYASPPSEEFTLYGYQQGSGLGPTLIAPYPGRLLAARNVMVLHLDVTEGAEFESPAEPEIRRRAFEAAAEHLVQAGLVDRHRIGLAGFSRNGYYVEYTLTHSDFPFAAAISADNWDPSYTTQTLLGYDEASREVHGAEAFGTGFEPWLKRAPGFNAEQVRTPLMKIEQSNGLLGVLLKWELFERLRHLGKPVEFYVMPDATHGAHNTQHPAHILAVQQRSIDWFDFWLNGREDRQAQKRLQYERWRGLRDLAERARARAPQHRDADAGSRSCPDHG